MNENITVALIASGAALLVAIGGWIVTYWLNRQGKKLDRQQRRIVKLEQDMRAHIAIEKEACAWLSEVNGRTEQANLPELRKRNFARTGLRPKLSLSDIRAPEEGGR